MPQTMNLIFQLSDGTERTATFTIPDEGSGTGGAALSVPGTTLPINPAPTKFSTVNVGGMDGNTMGYYTFSIGDTYSYEASGNLLRTALGEIFSSLSVGGSGDLRAMLMDGITDALDMMQIPIAEDRSFHLTIHGRVSATVDIHGPGGTLVKGPLHNDIHDFMIDFGRVKEGVEIVKLFETMGGNSFMAAARSWYGRISGEVAHGTYPGPQAPAYDFAEGALKVTGYMYIRP